jgi:hypothetical protein
MQPKPHGLLKRVWMRAGRAGSFRLHHLAQWLPGVPRLPLCLNFFPKFPHDKYILWKICHSPYGPPNHIDALSCGALLALLHRAWGRAVPRLGKTTLAFSNP